MPAIAFDLRQPELVAQQLAEANRQLARERTPPAATLALVEDVTQAIGEAADHELASINPWVWIAVQRAALHAQGALREPNAARRRRALRLALEQLRFLFARLADRQPVGEDRPIGDVARWLEGTLASTSQQRKADLLGVGLRTYQRWLSERDPTTPNADDERRLRLVARIVNQLRHSLTGPGVVDWFEHPRADLGGVRPLDALRAPDRLEPLLAAAAASRGNVAA
jgi:hypothetical protein